MGFATGALIIGGAAALYSGDQTRRAAKKQARITEDEAAENARRHEIEVRKFASEQELGFLSSGVVLEGSPLLVLKETREQGLLDAEGIRTAGRARASAIRGQGRSAFFSGIAQSIQLGAAAYDSYSPKAPRTTTTSTSGGRGPGGRSYFIGD
jgi:hypothetical protein